MRSTMIFFPLLTALSSLVSAGYNCKCQDPSGTGPQDNEATFYCCMSGRGTVDSCYNFDFPGKNNQCGANGDNCIDSGKFDLCCRSQGAPGAFCWK